MATDAIRINEEELEPIGQALLALIDAEEELLESIRNLNGALSTDFKGGALKGIMDCSGKILKQMNRTIGESIHKNFDDFKIIQNTFKEVDVTLQNYLDLNNFKTDDFEASLTTTPVGDTSGHVNYDVQHASGKQFVRVDGNGE